MTVMSVDCQKFIIGQSVGLGPEKRMLFVCNLKNWTLSIVLSMQLRARRCMRRARKPV